MRVLQTARQVKHLGFVINKRTRSWVRTTKFDVSTVVFRDVDRYRPFQYRAERYADTFLSETAAPCGSSELPRQVFAVWAGSNPMSANRRASVREIERCIGLPLVIVTPESLNQWVLPEAPLHPAYEHLSLIHRSDYLRGYLLHHHGGAYIDIKRPFGTWADSYEKMAADPSAWVTSYSAAHANWIGKVRGRLGRDILVHYRLMFGKSGFMMRSHTPLTAEWMKEMDRRLDEAHDDLIHHPGDAYGDDPAYPLSWTDLLGRVLDPLTLKYLSHVRLDDRMLLDFTDYR